MADVKNRKSSFESKIAELTLEEDDFGEPKVLIGASAIGQILLSLFQTPPGTIQDSPNLSIYMREFTNIVDDPSTRKDISTKIREGLTTYLPDFPYFDVQVDATIDTNTGKNILIIGIKTAENQFMFSATDNNNDLYTVEEIKLAPTVKF